MNARTGTTATDDASADSRMGPEIPEEVAEDHERLLVVIANYLAEVGVRSSLAAFHKITLRAEEFHRPQRYEPELAVFWAGEEREGIALKVRVAEKGGKTFYAWGGGGSADAHSAHDPLGAAAVIAEMAQAV